MPAPSTTSGNVVAYQGNCHCGAFKFAVDLPEIKRATTCNCSICVKKGYLCLTVREGDVEILRGKGELGSYAFGKEGWGHEFCNTCGTPVWVRKTGKGGEDEFALNIRTLMGLNPFSLEESEKLDAKDVEPIYVPPVFTGVLPVVADETGELKTYTGGCHCGAVTLAIKSVPLPKAEVQEDNCSICVRNASIFAYPARAHFAIAGAENLTSYYFGTKMAAHQFCKVCGVHLCIDLKAPPKEVWDSFSDEIRAVLTVKLGQVPVRIQVLDGVEWDELKVVRREPGTVGYLVD